MKTASELLDELLRETRPPPGTTIALTEDTPRRADAPNWTAGTGAMEQEALARYNAKFHALRESCPCVDWSAVAERAGERRRIAKRA